MTTEGERLQSEGRTHIQTGRYAAEAQTNQTAVPKSDRRYTISITHKLYVSEHLVSPLNMTEPLLPSEKQHQTESLSFTDAASS